MTMVLGLVGGLLLAASVAAAPPSASGGSDGGAVRAAWAVDTIEAYQAFLTAHPESRDAAEARARLTYLTAVARGGPGVYERFLRDVPTSPYAAEARKTLQLLHLRRVPLRVEIEIAQLHPEDLDHEAMRQELWTKMASILTQVGLTGVLLPPDPQPESTPLQGGRLSVAYREDPGEEFFHGTLSVFGLAEVVGIGTNITSRISLTFPGDEGPAWEERVSAATTLIVSEDLRQNAVENYWRRVTPTLLARLRWFGLTRQSTVIPISEPVQALAMTPTHLLIAAGAGGLGVVDIQDPASPTLLGMLKTADEVRDVAVLGSTVYLAVAKQGLQVLSLANPRRPRLLATLQTPCKALAVAVDQAHAAVACGSRGVVLFDLTTPRAPRRLGIVNTPTWAFDVAVAGQYAYIADRRTIEVVEIHTLKRVGSVVGAALVDQVELTPPMLLASHRRVQRGGARGTSSIQVLSLDTPQQPVVVASLEPPYAEAPPLDTGLAILTATARFGLQATHLGGGRLAAIKVAGALAFNRNLVAVVHPGRYIELVLLSPHMLRVLQSP